MTEGLHIRHPEQGRGTVESVGNHLYRVCGPEGCTVVMGLSNALYLSRNVADTVTPQQQILQKPLRYPRSMT